jgi:hypothetical protein
MKNMIYKSKDFLVESVKDNMPDCGWREITPTDYWTSELKKEEFTREEKDYLVNFAKENNLSEPVFWGSGCNIYTKDSSNRSGRLVITKHEDEWFIVDSTFFNIPDKPGETEQNNYIVDQNGIRESV